MVFYKVDDFCNYNFGYDDYNYSADYIFTNEFQSVVWKHCIPPFFLVMSCWLVTFSHFGFGSGECCFVGGCPLTRQTGRAILFGNRKVVFIEKSILVSWEAPFKYTITVNRFTRRFFI